MTSLDKLTKAKLLLNACFELENRYEDGYRTLESDYSLPEEFWSDCQMDELKLISLTKSTFSDLDDDGFLSSLLGADSGLNSSYGSFTATISFLKTYIDSVHPVYLDDLLRDAEKLRDSNFHLCAIHNIRLFCIVQLFSLNIPVFLIKTKTFPVYAKNTRKIILSGASSHSRYIFMYLQNYIQRIIIHHLLRLPIPALVMPSTD